MKTRNLLRFSVLIIITLLLCLSSCPHPELPGDIEGIVIDAKTSEPIYQAKVKLDTPDDSTSTQINGSYILKNIDPGNYEIKASKSGYAPETENVKVISHRPVEKNFSLTEIPTLKVSTNKLDFGLDSTSLKFYISKVGSGTLAYAILTSQDWIKSSPENGELAEGTDSAVVNVNINRADLLKRKYIDTITVSQMYGTEVIQEVKIGVYLNGIWINLKYVNIVLIGTQVWMGENLNVGTRIDGSKDQADNGITEKYCYSDGEYNCDTYGGLYQWDEMMQYNPPEDSSKIIGTTQGICPDGWHLPALKEFFTLRDCLGDGPVAGGKLKETGNIHWATPNSGATNESGFTALPGGHRGTNGVFYSLGTIDDLWSTSSNVFLIGKEMRDEWYLTSDKATFEYSAAGQKCGYSVRCVRNP